MGSGFLITSMGLNAQTLYHQGSEAQDSIPLSFTTGAALIYDDGIVPSYATRSEIEFEVHAGYTTGVLPPDGDIIGGTLLLDFNSHFRSATPATQSEVTLSMTISRTVAGVSRLERGEQINAGRIVKTAFNNKTFLQAMNQAGYLPDGRIEGWRLVMVNLSPDTAQGQRVFYLVKKTKAVSIPSEILQIRPEGLGEAETYRERVSVNQGELISGETSEFRRVWNIEGEDPATEVEFRGVGVLKGRDVSGPVMMNREPLFFSYRWTRASLSGVVGAMEIPAETASLIEGSVSFSEERPIQIVEN
jgi:hypothetical protein